MEGTRLTLARKLRGFSKRELAELVKVTPKSIADYENDITNPSTEIEQRLIRTLRFPEAFFNLHTTEPMPEEAISFRARTKLKRSQKDIATAEATIATELSGPCDTIMYKIVHNVVWIDMGETNMLQRRGANW